MNYTPDMRDGANVFVFGSNLLGIHGAGAAKEARKHWGAVYGFGRGPRGDSYAIPTKDEKLQPLPLGKIQAYVEEFIQYAKKNKDRVFLVTAVGCGLAGYRASHIKPMFAKAPKNCVLPEEFQ